MANKEETILVLRDKTINALKNFRVNTDSFESILKSKSEFERLFKLYDALENIVNQADGI